MPKELANTSESVDDYLKAIFELAGQDRRAGTSDLARRLGVSAASVTGMLQKLASAEPALVRYEKRRGAELTESGEQRALEVIRHHRLLESYLYAALGYPWDKVHQEAERLEHFISEEFEARIAAHLGDPEFDPHGHPIPRKDGSLPQLDDVALRLAPAGSRARITRVSDEDPELLRFLASHGMQPETAIEVLEHQRFEGPTMLRIPPADPFPISQTVAGRVWVEVLAEGGSQSEVGRDETRCGGASDGH
jgi:DtxR family transcriptional regulator, Mn-dependent transcriptional regulator